MSSTISDIQKILVTLSEPEVVIEPGGVAQLVVAMTNQQAAADRLLLDVEGLDIEWYHIPVAAVNVAPGAQTSERVLFKIARSSENHAGVYPFLVRVQAMETGETGVAQATLIVKPFNSLQVELNPKRSVATFFHPLNDFDVTVSNLGNAEETLELYANDPEDGCAYEFDTDRITLKPGQTQVVPMALRPKLMSVLGSTRLYGFSVSARSVNDSYVSANVHGQVEKRPLISILLGIFVLLLVFGSLGWWVFHPRPQPLTKLNAFSASSSRVNAGQEATLTWDISNNYRQIIVFSKVKGEEEVAEPGEQKVAVGSVHVVPKPPETTYRILVRGNGPDQERKISIGVTPPPPGPILKIKYFVAEPDKVHQGEPVLLKWEALGHKQLILDPGGPPLNRYQQTLQVMPDHDTEYTLRAVGEKDNAPPVSKMFKVTVVSKDTALAEIKQFDCKPSSMYVGDKVKLRWVTKYTRSVQITSDHGDAFGDLKTTGSVEFTASLPTIFTLTATDNIGKTTTKTFTLMPKVRPVVPDTPSSTPSGDTTPPPLSKGGQ